MEKLIPFEKPDMIEFQGTEEEWLDTISWKKFGFLKKAKNWHFVIFYWEKSDDYYLNVSEFKGKGKRTVSVWVTRRDSLQFVQSKIGKGFKMYIDGSV
jgi:hypothetical protein